MQPDRMLVAGTRRALGLAALVQGKGSDRSRGLC